MLKTRWNYWSNSKFADWVRGSKKPHALQWDDWKIWHKEAKIKYPIRYWISETLLKKLQDIVYFPHDLYHTVEIYVRNRFIDKTHYLKTDLKPGEYYDLDTRLLHGIMNELVNYVEVELAHVYRCNDYQKYKLKHGRCPQAGLDYLAWACSLVYDESYGMQPDDKDYGKPTEQALNAYKIRKIYNWWKNERPNRINPYAYKEIDENNPVDTKKNKKKCIIQAHKIEEKYNNEDTEMLIKLIKLRDSLWT
jgi:hypothetical protein